MANPEFNKANAISRGKFAMDVVTNVVRLPDGNFVPLTDREAAVFAVYTPANICLHDGRLANRVTSILFELWKTDPLRRKNFVSISIGQFVSTKYYLQRELLPGWSG